MTVCEAVLGLHAMGQLPRSGICFQFNGRTGLCHRDAIRKTETEKLFRTENPVSSANNCKENKREGRGPCGFKDLRYIQVSEYMDFIWILSWKAIKKLQESWEYLNTDWLFDDVKELLLIFWGVK